MIATDMLSRFHLMPERYGQTDGRTDRQTDLLYQYRASVSMLTRGKNRLGAHWKHRDFLFHYRASYMGTGD